MANVALRSSLRTTLYAGAAAYVSYQGYQYYSTTNSSFIRQVHAESPPSDTKAALSKMPWKGFTELKLESAEMVNHNVRRLTFSLPSDDTTTGLAPVTSLLTQHTPEGAWMPVFRPYTPISSGSEPGRVTFLVKRYEGGKGSGKMHSLNPGDTLKFKPLHELDYKPNEHESVLIIAGGSGITPIYQLTNAILSNPTDKTKITLIYANNSEQDILLRADLEALERQHPDRFRKLFTTTKKPDTDPEGVETGYVTREMIAKVWPARRPGQKVLVSGPPAMTAAVAGAKGGFGWTQGSVGGILKELGYESGEVHKF